MELTHFLVYLVVDICQFVFREGPGWIALYVSFLRANWASVVYQSALRWFTCSLVYQSTCNGLPRNWLVFNPLSFCRVLIFSVFRNFDGSESGSPSQHLLLTLKQNHNYVVRGVSTFEILKCGHLDESN